MDVVYPIQSDSHLS